MNKIESLKYKIRLQQEKLNAILENSDKGILILDETCELSRELDKLILEFYRLER